jgi:hypothetical protein
MKPPWRSILCTKRLADVYLCFCHRQQRFSLPYSGSPTSCLRPLNNASTSTLTVSCASCYTSYSNPSTGLSLNSKTSNAHKTGAVSSSYLPPRRWERTRVNFLYDMKLRYGSIRHGRKCCHCSSQIENRSPKFPCRIRCVCHMEGRCSSELCVRRIPKWGWKGRRSVGVRSYFSCKVARMTWRDW